MCGGLRNAMSRTTTWGRDMEAAGALEQTVRCGLPAEWVADYRLSGGCVKP
jgi:hypothetical protein